MPIILSNANRDNPTDCTCPKTVLFSGAIEPWQAKAVSVLATKLGCTEDAIVRSGITLIVGLVDAFHQVPELYNFPTTPSCGRGEKSNSSKNFPPQEWGGVGVGLNVRF